jgi:uracil-DNA glycosylase
MRSVLLALTDELRRLKAAGVKTVAVSEDTLAGLRRLVAKRQTEAGPRAAVPAAAEAPAAPAPGLPSGEPRRELSTLRQPANAAPKLLPPPPVVVLPEVEKPARWQALREQVLNHPVCQAQVRSGRKVVFGVGNIDARIMFVGEAPGAEEELQGEPFVGPAGQLLTKMIKAMGLERSDVYIGNIMNWRPEIAARGDGPQVGNREPTPEEIAFCLPFITAQIDVVSPELIVALGATAARGLLGQHSFRSLGEVRGRWHDFKGRPLRVTYHPSYLLRKEVEGKTAELRAKRAAWEDFLAVMERAVLPIADKQRQYFLR